MKLNPTGEAFMSGLENDKSDVRIFLVCTSEKDFSKTDRRIGVSFRYDEDCITALKKILGYKCIRSFFLFYLGRNPRKLSVEDIKSFLFYLIEEKKRYSGTINQYINAFRFLYVDVYKGQFQKFKYKFSVIDFIV
ncbi:MAG: phage integrase N-terminal SAM-like domain-containing protein, partial [Bacteroidota bacterium]|nr:phage integrase N-terminal SAM-like domain-containing protein [Bacteroidota bacterium]